MQLEFASGTRLTDPDPAAIDAALSGLGTSSDYAILSEADEEYLQTAGDPNKGFVLEFRAGSAEEHYESIRRNLTLDEVRMAFRYYATRDPAWRNLVEWKKQEPAAWRRGNPFIFVAAMAAAIIFVVSIIQYIRRGLPP